MELLYITNIEIISYMKNVGRGFYFSGKYKIYEYFHLKGK